MRKVIGKSLFGLLLSSMILSGCALNFLEAVGGRSGEPSIFQGKIIANIIEEVGFWLGIDLKPISGQEDPGEELSRTV